MKKLRLLLPALLAAAAAVFGSSAPSVPVSLAAQEADTAAGNAWTAERCLPYGEYRPLAPTIDVAASDDTVAVMTSRSLEIFTDAPDGTRRLGIPMTNGTAVGIGASVVTLAGETVTVRAETPFDTIVPGAKDLAVYGDRVAVLTETEITVYAIGETSLEKTETVDTLPAGAVRLYADGIRTAVLCRGAQKDAIYDLNGTAWEAVAAEPKIHAFVYRGNKLIYLTDAALNATDGTTGARYPLQTGNAVLEGRLSTSPAAIGTRGENLLIADTLDSVGFVQAFRLDDAGLEYLESVCVSADTTVGRFRAPSSVSAGRNEILVADTLNRRIQRFDDGIPTVTEEFSKPDSVLVGGDGTEYVLDREGTRLTVLTGESRSAPAYPEGKTRATDLALRGNGSALIAIDGNVYAIENGVVAEELYDGGDARRVAANELSEALWILTDSAVVKAENGDRHVVAPSNGAIDLDTDEAETIYLLGTDGITTIGKDGTVRTHATDSAYPIGEAAELSIVRYCIDLDRDGKTDEGSLLLAAPDANAIFRIDREAAETSLPDREGFAPTVDPTEAAPGSFRIHTLSSSAPLASYPSLGDAFLTVPAGTRVFVLADETVSDFFCQIAAELPDAVTMPHADAPSKFVYGFLPKSALGNAASDAQTPFVDGLTLNPDTKIYKYPCIYSPVLETRETKGAAVKLVVMPPYKDTSNNDWVAVETENGVGYALAANVVKRYYVPTTEPLRTNATLHATGIAGIAVYELSPGGTYAATELFLPDNARIRLADDYDSRAEYAHILYADDNGLLDCFVPNANVERDGMGVVEATAVALILVTLTIGAVVFFVSRKNRI